MNRTPVLEPGSAGAVLWGFVEPPIGARVGESFRVAVLVPTVSNPPGRVPFAAELIVEWESFLFEVSDGWTLRPGLYVGEWSSSTQGRVRDESRVYDVIAPTLDQAFDVAVQLYAFVREHFAQEHVLINITPEFSTLFVGPGLTGTTRVAS